MKNKNIKYLMTTCFIASIVFCPYSTASAQNERVERRDRGIEHEHHDDRNQHHGHPAEYDRHDHYHGHGEHRGRFYHNGHYYAYRHNGSYYNFFYHGAYYKTCRDAPGYRSHGVWIRPTMICQ